MTEGGLSRLKDGRITTLRSSNGLPCDSVYWMMEDDARALWLYMTCSLVRIARSELDAWVTDPKRTIQVAVFDSSDGYRSVPLTSASVRRSPKPRMENCGSGLSMASASSIRSILPSTTLRHRYTSSRLSPTAGPTMRRPMRNGHCSCPR